MKCRICGRECPPAAKICRDCASARKRAFAATVTQPLLAAVGVPSVAEPRFAPRPPRRRAANDSAVGRAPIPGVLPEAALPLTVVPHRHGVVWFVIAAMIIVGVLIAIMRTASNGYHVTDEVVPKVAPARVSDPAPPVVEEVAPDPSVSEAAPSRSVASKPLRRPVPRVEPASPVVAEPDPAAEAAPAAKPPSPARSVEAPRSDPWQALNEGLARCAREGFLDRIGCEQRLRAQYCGNSWGLVPQCPIGPATDHGQ